MRSMRNTSTASDAASRVVADRTIPWGKSTPTCSKSFRVYQPSADICVKGQVLRYLILLMLTAAFTSILAAQNYQLRAKVDLVVVPTSVRDSKGNLVAGLKKDDFTIFE